MADWAAIKNEYVTSSISQRELAKKHCVSLRAVANHAKAEAWVAQKNRNCNDIATKMQQKSAEKIVDAVSDTAAIKARLERTFWNLIEQAASELTQTGTIDPADLRRVVQCYVDMRNLPEDVQSNEEQHNALMGALREAAKREN